MSVGIWDRVYERDGDVVARLIADETVLVPIKGHLADMRCIYTLNAVGRFIWDAIDGARPLEEIRAVVLSEFDVDMVQAGADINEFIDMLAKAGLIRASRG